MIFKLLFLVCLLKANINSAIVDDILEEKEHSKPQKVKCLTAKERFEIVRGYLECDQSLTMTKTWPKLYDDIYVKDLRFIRYSIIQEGRQNAQVLCSLLDILDDIVSKLYKANMTFADLNHIGFMWVKVLSQASGAAGTNFFATDIAEYSQAITTYKKYNMVDNSPYTPSVRCIESPGLVMPHVSKTGAVPLEILNEGFGFYVGGKAFSLDFLAVATAPKVSFDYLRGQTAFDSWYHDMEHLGRASRLSEDHSIFKLRTTNIANLRLAIKKLPINVESSQAELAFFMLFHESQDSVYIIGKHIDEMITSYERILIQGRAASSGFNSLEQYETYVKAASSLGLSIDEGDTVDKYKSFVMHLVGGLKIVRGLGHIHDK